CVPERRWCTDNAAMIAVLGARTIEAKRAAYAEWHGTKDLLGPEASATVGALPRCPITELAR
ncbi:MAG: hypothetical protein KDD69_16320, partial [Bdellovibrionales bacterium]|nr:hypothetical protein [Bdellovibrionales bacterium]